ncbi:DEKNAAC104313 [Brettanomyces naardenensis]|uniref:DEKNAAC104313 n=1 Tax=Brettanomyces naardenensis TaxID=13370 RepID=A0A448YQI3_BRENA|nr:DEKNAAC104313 [Brettanomyces naardenensis]
MATLSKSTTPTTSSAQTVSTQPTSTSHSKTAAVLNVTGPVSPSIDQSLRDKLTKIEEKKRKPHPAAFRGWKEVSGFEDGDQLTPTDEIMDLLTSSTLLEQYLPDYLYGDWYHIVAIILIGSLLSWILGHFGFFLGPVFFVTVPVALYYRLSIRTYRQSIRMEAQREFSVAAIEDDFETLDWMNVFLEKLWPYVEPFVAEQVCDQANTILADLPYLPDFVKQVWIHTFTVGTKAPRVDKVRTLERTSDDVTVMDWWVSFIPNAVADMTHKQLKNRANQEVIVKAKLFGLTLPIFVSDAAFRAKIRVRLRMMANFPHIQTVNVSLMEPPYFDAITKPIGGDSLFTSEVFSLPGLYSFINEMVAKFAGPMLFSPLSFQVNLEQLLAGNGLRGALGILELNIKHAKGLRGADTYDNTIDPYFTFGFSGKVLAKTKVAPDTTDPVYNEKINVMLKTSTEPLAIILYDENESDGRKDKFMGAALYDLENIMVKGEISDITLPVLRNNRPAGEVTIGLKLMKSLQGSKLPDGSYSPPPDLNTGVLNLKLLGARSYSEDNEKPASVFADVYVNRRKQLTSGVVKKAKDASWNLEFEDIVTDRAHCNVRVVLRDPAKPQESIGSTTLRLTDIIDASYVGNDWFTMNKGLGEVNLSCEWNSVHMTGVVGSIGYTEPIGVVRVYISQAGDLLNLEKIGTIDPYIRLMINGVQRGKTLTMRSTTDPIFAQSLYIPVSSPNQRIVIEAMDVERSTPDRTLGSFQVHLDKFIQYDDKGEPVETIGDTKKSVLVHPRRGPKGHVEYSLSFFPCKAVRTPGQVKEHEKHVEEIKKTIVEKKEKKESTEGEEDELEEFEAAKPRAELSVDKLHNYDVGVLVFSILEGQFPTDGYLQVFFDMQGYATLESGPVGPRRKRVGLTGDVLIKELNEFSTVTFKFVKKKGGNIKGEAVKEITIPTIKFLESAYDKQTTMKLGDDSCKFAVRARFIPVIMSSLPPADSIGNSGTLYLKILRADGLPAGDSNGKSDPFAKFYLNGEEVYKTKTKKKTLEPEWNEETQISIDNRMASALRIKVNDWDFGVEQDDELGEYTLSLSEINPFSSSWQDLQFALADTDNRPAGQVYLQALFKPQYHTVLSAEKSLANAGDLAVDGAGKILGTGVGATGKVLGTAGKVGGKVLGTAGGLFKRKK